MAGIAAFGFGMVALRGREVLWLALLQLRSMVATDAIVGTHVFGTLLIVPVSYFLFLTLLLNGLRANTQDLKVSPSD